MNTDLINEFEETTAGLLQTISSFSEKQFNQVPFEGSWTVGQVAEHLFKSDSGILAILNGKVIQTTGREPNANEAEIRSIFLDLKTKFKAADNVYPSGGAKDKDVLLNEFKKTKSALRKILDTEDLTVTCTDFPFSGIGEMTRYEWICFLNCHTSRHTQQMKNIYEKIKT